MTQTLVPNGGFEIPGANPWGALGWSRTIVNSLEEYAGFSVGAYDVGWEGFELGWNNDDFQIEFGPSDVEAVIFNDGSAVVTQEVEDFEGAWLGNENWHDELISTDAAVFDSTPEPFEDHEEEWDSNEDWRRYFAPPAFSIWVVAAGQYRVNLLGQTFFYQADGTEAGRYVIAGALKDEIDAAGLPVTTTREHNVVIIEPSPKALDVALDVTGPVDHAISIIAYYLDEDLEAAVFNTTTDDADGFEREWRGNEDFEFSLGAVFVAEFDTTLDPYEDFEEEWPTEQMQTII